jgi:hypothetical protein
MSRYIYISEEYYGSERVVIIVVIIIINLILHALHETKNQHGFLVSLVV